jgi:cysteine desulfurase
MLPYLAGEHGNPSGAHRMARTARKAIDDAREIVAASCGVHAREVVFTSGGTEADNLAVLGAHDARGGTIVCSAVEHHAVLDPVRHRGGRLAGVRPDGAVDLVALERALDDEVTLVSVMLANNEVGTIQPLAEVVELVRAHAPGALVHTDAVQAVPWVDVAALAASADLVSISAHKVGGPKGVGALLVRERAAGKVAARQLGGGQEHERRSGTQNVAGIVGLGAAMQRTVEERFATVERVTKLRDRLADGLLASVTGVVETGGADRSGRIGGICHLCFEQVESEALLFLLEDADVFASAGSSCASGATEPSHVLTAMGIGPPWDTGALRLSLGAASTEADVDAALDAIPRAVDRLRSFA